MTEVTFDEDKTYQHTLDPANKIPQRGFEGWFYRKFPGGYFLKKSILYGIVLLMFAASFYFIALARFNVQTSDQEQQEVRTNNLKVN